MNTKTGDWSLFRFLYTISVKKNIYFLLVKPLVPGVFEHIYPFLILLFTLNPLNVFIICHIYPDPLLPLPGWKRKLCPNSPGLSGNFLAYFPCPILLFTLRPFNVSIICNIYPKPFNALTGLKAEALPKFLSLPWPENFLAYYFHIILLFTLRPNFPPWVCFVNSLFYHHNFRYVSIPLSPLLLSPPSPS